MKIDLTKNDYLTLLEIFEMAHWVLFAHKTDESEDTRKYQDLEQKIFSYAKDLGYGRFIEYVKEHERYFPTREYEEKSPAMDYIQEFENETFWEELIERFVERDLLRELGDKAFRSLDLLQRFEKEEPYQKKYIDEFATNGLERLEISTRQKGKAKK